MKLFQRALLLPASVLQAILLRGNRLRVGLVFAAASSLLLAAPAQANDFPTIDRVVYVQECMRAHPGPQFEMQNKCACSLDAIAREVKYDEFVALSTVAKAMTIGGERGSSIRDAPSLEPQAKRYRELVSKSEKNCFIGMEIK